MRYAQTGIRGYVPPGQACAGHRYEDRPDKADPHMSVDCGRCEPFLAKDPLWAAAPSEVPLTETERRAADAAKQTFDAVAAQSVAALAAALAGGGLSLAQVAGAVAPGAALPAAPVAGAPAAAPAKRSTRGRKPAAAKTAA
jgi:hypothetical protein